MGELESSTERLYSTITLVKFSIRKSGPVPRFLLATPFALMKAFLFFLLVLMAACNSKSPNDPATYYNLHQQDSLKTRIATYLLDAPPYTAMKDRFESKYWDFYSKKASRFEINKLFVDKKDGKHFFYVLRPASKTNENRGVGGYFYVDKNFQLKDFHEVYVTPILPAAEVKGRCAFLFDEMVKNSIEKFLSMEMYVQWPNKITYYDTTTYEWRPIPGSLK